MTPQHYTSADPEEKEEQRQNWLRRLAENLKQSQALAHAAIASTNCWSKEAYSVQTTVGDQAGSYQEVALEQARQAFGRPSQLDAASKAVPLESAAWVSLKSIDQMQVQSSDAHAQQPLETPASFLGEPDVAVRTASQDSLPAHSQLLASASPRLAEDIEELQHEPSSHAPLQLSLPYPTSVFISLLSFVYPGASGIQLLGAPVSVISEVVHAAHELQISGVKEFVDALLKTRTLNPADAMTVYHMGVTCRVPQWLELVAGAVTIEDVKVLGERLAAKEKYQEAYEILKQYFYHK